MEGEQIFQRASQNVFEKWPWNVSSQRRMETNKDHISTNERSFVFELRFAAGSNFSKCATVVNSSLGVSNYGGWSSTVIAVGVGNFLVLGARFHNIPSRFLLPFNASFPFFFFLVAGTGAEASTSLIIACLLTALFSLLLSSYEASSYSHFLPLGFLSHIFLFPSSPCFTPSPPTFPFLLQKPREIIEGHRPPEFKA